MSENEVTAEIAAAAARLVIEEGMDYASAKRKAARAMEGPGRGARHGRGIELPSHEAVEDEVRAQLALFHADTQPAELRALREIARHWMQRLAPLRPHLAGAVWRGTATRRSPIVLELYADDPKAAAIELLNQGLETDVVVQPDPHPARRGADREVLVTDLRPRLPGRPRTDVLGDWVSLHLVPLDHDDLRGALKPDARGRSWRGDLPALDRLAQADEAGEAGADGGPGAGNEPVDPNHPSNPSSDRAPGAEDPGRSATRPSPASQGGSR